MQRRMRVVGAALLVMLAVAVTAATTGVGASVQLPAARTAPGGHDTAILRPHAGLALGDTAAEHSGQLPLDVRELHTADGDRLFVADPRVVRVEGRTLLFGFPSAVIRNDSGIAVGAGAELTGDGVGRLIPLPAPGTLMRAVRVAVDPTPAGRGRVHVLWGEPSEAHPQGGPVHAAVWDGARWSPPELLVGGHAVRWDAASVGALVTVGQSLYAVVPSSPRDSSESFEGYLVLEHVDGRWRTHRVPVTPLAEMVRAAPASDGLVLAFAAITRLPDDPPEGTGPGAALSLYTARWTAAHGLERIRRLDAPYPRSLQDIAMHAAATGGRVTLFWTVAGSEDRPDPTNAAQRWTLSTARSTDAGQTWSTPRVVRDGKRPLGNLRTYDGDIANAGIAYSVDPDGASFGFFGAPVDTNDHEQLCRTSARLASGEGERVLGTTESLPSGEWRTREYQSKAAGLVTVWQSPVDTLAVWVEITAMQRGVNPHTCIAGRAFGTK